MMIPLSRYAQLRKCSLLNKGVTIVQIRLTKILFGQTVFHHVESVISPYVENNVEFFPEFIIPFLICLSFQMRVYARREQEFQDSADYALEVTPDIIKEYEKFYKVPYPLPKLGMCKTTAVKPP